MGKYDEARKRIKEEEEAEAKRKREAQYRAYGQGQVSAGTIGKKTGDGEYGVDDIKSSPYLSEQEKKKRSIDKPVNDFLDRAETNAGPFGGLIDAGRKVVPQIGNALATGTKQTATGLLGTAQMVRGINTTSGMTYDQMTDPDTARRRLTGEFMEDNVSRLDTDPLYQFLNNTTSKLSTETQNIRNQRKDAGYIGNLALGTLESLPTTLSSVIGTGIGGPAVGAGIMASSSGGNAFLQELALGNSFQKSALSGIGQGGVEAGFNQLPMLDRLENLGLKEGAKMTVRKIAQSLFKEGLEEAGTEVGQWLVRKLITNPDEELSLEDVRDAFAGGVMMGGFFQGLGVATRGDKNYTQAPPVRATTSPVPSDFVYSGAIDRNVLKTALETALKDGGYSVNKDGVIPTDGIMAGKAGKGIAIDTKDASLEVLEYYVDNRMDELGKDANFLGLWEDNGKLYLDISERVNNNAQDLYKISESGELEVYDVARGRSYKLQESYKDMPKIKGVQVIDPATIFDDSKIESENENGSVTVGGVEYFAVTSQNTKHKVFQENGTWKFTSTLTNVPKSTGADNLTDALRYISSTTTKNLQPVPREATKKRTTENQELMSRIGEKDGTVTLYHYSKGQDMDYVDAEHMGKGDAGAEMKRIFKQDGSLLHGQEKEVAFFTKQSDGEESHRFGNMNRYEAKVDADDLYDFTANPDRLHNVSEVKASGYRGYIIKNNGTEQVRMFDDVKVTPIPKASYGYHAGDLGKAEYLSSMAERRGTGHFGTGTYFVGDKSKFTSNYKDRPSHKIDFEKYKDKLFKPATSEKANSLHDALAEINNNINNEYAFITDRQRRVLERQIEDKLMDENNTYDEERALEDKLEKIRDSADIVREIKYNILRAELKVDPDNVPDLLRKIRNDIMTEKGQMDIIDTVGLDSASTRFMKALGYNGVDVRGLSADGVDRGSVIYELREQDLPPETLKKNQSIESRRREMLGLEPLPVRDESIEMTKEQRKVGDTEITQVVFEKDGGRLAIWENSPYAQGRHSIYDFFVPEESRGKGIGSALLREAIKFYGDNFSAQVSNENSVNVHYTNGFRPLKNLEATREQAVQMFRDTEVESMNMVYVKGAEQNKVATQKFEITDNMRSQGVKFIYETLASHDVKYSENQIYNLAKAYALGIDIKNAEDIAMQVTVDYMNMQDVQFGQPEQTAEDIELPEFDVEKNLGPALGRQSDLFGSVRELSKMSLKDRLKSFRRGAIDNLADLRDYSEKAYKSAFRSRQGEGIKNSIFRDALVDSEGQVAYDKSFESLFKGIKREDMSLLSEIMILQHAKDWASQGKEVSIDPSFNKESNQARLDTYKETHPELFIRAESIVDWYQEFVKTWMVDTGFISSDVYAEWQELNPHYVPFNRILPPEQRVQGKGIKQMSDVERVVYDAGGSDLKLIDPIESMMMNISRTVDVVMKNRAKQALVETASTYNDISKGIIELIPDIEEVKVLSSAVKYYRKLMYEGNVENDAPYGSVQAFDIDEIAYDPEMMDRSMEMQYFFEKASGIYKYKDAPNVMSVTSKGKTDFYLINDANLFASIEAMNKVTNQKVLQSVSQITRFMKLTTTGANPLFGITRNIFRDFPTGYVNSKTTDNIFKYTTDWAGAVIEVFAEAMPKNIRTGIENALNIDIHDLQEFRRAGGGMNQSAISSRKGVTKSMNKLTQHKNRFESFLDAIETFNDLIETAPRLAEFKRAKAEGMSLDEAMYEASEVTTNFLRHGTVSKEIDAFVPFFNASVVGLEKIHDTYAKDPTRAIIKSFIGITIPTMILYAFNHDDEDYEKLSSWMKDNYYMIPTGDGRFVRIAKPREYGAIFSSGMERIMKKIKDDDPDAFKGYVDFLLATFLPPNPLSDNILSPVMTDLPANKDFAGRPIEPSYMENWANKDKYTDRTSELSRVLGGFFDFSPIALDYVIKSYTGVIGQLGLPIISGGAKGDMFGTLGETLKNTMISDPLYSNDSMANFYERKGELEQIYNSAKNNRGEPMTGEQMVERRLYSRVGSTISEISSLSRRLQNGTLTEEDDRLVYGVTGLNPYLVASDEVLEELKKYTLVLTESVRTMGYSETAMSLFNEYSELTGEAMLPMGAQPSFKSGNREVYLSKDRAQLFNEMLAIEVNNMVDIVLADERWISGEDVNRIALLKQAISTAEGNVKNHFARLEE